MARKIIRQFIMVTALMLIFVQAALAAPVQINNARFSNNAVKIRIVYDVSQLPAYKLDYSSDGRQVTLEMDGLAKAALPDGYAVNDIAVRDIKFTRTADKLKTVINLNRSVKDGIKVEVNSLKNPNRLYIDIIKKFDQKFTEQVQDGLIYTKFLRNNERGLLTAYFLEVDPKAGYEIKPILAQDKIIGREALSTMTARNRAIAAVNSSYFGPSGELIGFTKIAGEIASTTYVKRGALGINSDASFFTGQVTYSGTVTTKYGTLYLSGVNCERGENGTVVYNHYFGRATGTNEYGREYAVKNGVVVGIYNNNASLSAGIKIVSVHGSSAAALAKVKIGDAMVIKDSVDSIWDKAEYAVGVGPLLVQKGEVYLTTSDEQFGPDVAAGRAPRTAAGIMSNGHLLLGIVDGRQSHSIGCTLGEMAALMKEFGAVEAVNFDGGGSTEMIVKDKIVNSPSDGQERRVGAGLGVFAKH